MNWFALILIMAQLYGADPVSPAPSSPSIILGGGVGALTSALYLARAGIRPLVIEGDQPGGLLMQSASVQNWPGEMDISGSDLVEKMRRQAEENGAQFLAERVVRIDFSKRPFLVVTRSVLGEERQLYGDTCILAMGTEPNHLEIPGERNYWGKGVSSCAICDGSLYRDQQVGVVGGGDAAVTEALYLSNLAKKVHLLVRGKQLKTTDRQRVDLLSSRPNVEIHYQTTVQEIRGEEGKLSALTLRQGTQEHVFPLDGLFLAIGSRPNSSLFRGVLQLDRAGYIVVDKNHQTSLKGVYAVGDIADPEYQQAISAAGDGAKAALEVQKYLAEHPTPMQKIALEQKVGGDSKVLDIQSREEFERELKTGNMPIVVDFYATWCPPCKLISPRVDAAAHQLSGTVKFLKVNVDLLHGLSRSYQITSMPTILFFSSDGQLTDRREGTEEISTFLHRLEATP